MIVIEGYNFPTIFIHVRQSYFGSLQKSHAMRATAAAAAVVAATTTTTIATTTTATTATEMRLSSSDKSKKYRATPIDSVDESENCSGFGEVQLVVVVVVVLLVVVVVVAVVYVIR